MTLCNAVVEASIFIGTRNEKDICQPDFGEDLSSWAKHGCQNLVV